MAPSPARIIPGSYVRDLIRRDMERREGAIVWDAILGGYRDAAAGRVFASSGNFKTDMETLDRKEADGCAASKP